MCMVITVMIPIQKVRKNGEMNCRKPELEQKVKIGGQVKLHRLGLRD